MPKTVKKTSVIGKLAKVNELGINFILLLNVIFNQYFQFVKLHTPEPHIKKLILSTLKMVRKNNKLIKAGTTDAQLLKMYVQIKTAADELITAIPSIVKKSKTQKLKLKQKLNGGFYFRDIEDKGDQPITGADVSRLLDEMQDFIYNLKYTQEGAFLQDVDILISMLRGDLSQFKSYLTWRIFPQYYQVTPPFIKWDAIKQAWNSRKYEDIPDYLIAYQKYLKSRDEYLVAKGLKSPNVLKKDLYVGFYDKLANSLDRNILAYQQLRRKAQMNFYPISVPV